MTDYTPTAWNDDAPPAISAANLNKIEAGIDTAHDEMVQKSLLTAIGDLIYGSAVGVASRLGIGATGKVLTVVGGIPAWADASGPVRYPLTGDVDATNSTAEQTLVSQSIGAGVMGTDKLLRCTVLGDLLNNSGSRTLTLRVKFGGTTIYQDSYTNPSVADADRCGFRFVIEIGNKADAAIQFGVFQFFMGDMSTAHAPPTTGVGEFETQNFLGQPVATNGNIAIDTSTAKTLEVTAQWDLATANVSLRKKYALVEIV